MGAVGEEARAHLPTEALADEGCEVVRRLQNAHLPELFVRRLFPANKWGIIIIGSLKQV